MKFMHGTRRRALEYEKDWVQRWKDDGTFEKSVEQRPVENSYVFYDGPPFISGNPHHGTLLSSIVKDAVPRYQTMKGKRVERVWGWDCHGLPAERYTEKKLGLSSREEVIEYGIEKYIKACRANMVQTSSEWNDVVDRVGRWVDMDNAYKTMDKEYMESVWWAFKELYDKGKIYEGEKVLMYCTLDATPLSKAEVTMDAGAYQDVTDPSVFVKFKLENNDQKSNTLKKDSKVLFVCYANVNRSQIGKALFNHITESNNASSAGVAVNQIHPQSTTYSEAMDEFMVGATNKHQGRARTYLQEHYGIDIGSSIRRQLTPADLKEYDLIVDITGENDAPSWLVGDNVVHWNIDDTVGEGVDRNQVIADNTKEIEARIKRLVAGEAVNDRVQAVNLLAWTTTPWTLPANTALAVSKDLDYVEVRVGDEQFILAKKLVEKVLQDEKHQPLDYEVVRELKGAELVGLQYEPLLGEDRGVNAHKVWSADYVSDEDGTGIVHLAPAYGEEDFELAKKEKIPVVHVIDENGLFTEGDWQGQNVWEINKQIAKDLKERGIVWKIDYIRHSYPHCHRCGTKLMYRAHPSWFMDIDGQREQMLDKNTPINWFPEHLKHGRFEKTVQSAPDWNISRDRFWATAMPVWKGTDSQGKEHVKVVGSYSELKELSGVELEDYHRPWVDDITFAIDGVTYTRTDKVMDSWFEAASMPFAQFHYPFENKEKFENNFPGEFITEYVGQVRAWFYYMHAMSVALFGENSFKNVITTGTLAGSDGRKMSKSYGNYTDPNILMDTYSADSLRFTLLSSPVLNGEDFSLQDKNVGDVARKLSMVWNMYDFFTMYAEVDGWEFNGDLSDPLTDTEVASSASPNSSVEPASRPSSIEHSSVSDGAADGSSDKHGKSATDAVSNPLDIWIVSRLHQLVGEVERHMDAYNIPDALSPILPFLDDASNWFVRRSRRRFWKSEDDGDKNDAYRTLHYVLTRLSYVLAPFAPFMAEELHEKMTGDEESVHLKDWLSAGQINELVMNDMETVREYVNEGLSMRARAGLKVRQPLASVTVPTMGTNVDFESILLDELNVKSVKIGDAVAIDETLTPELKREGLMREVIRHVQSARKKADLNIDDRIELNLETESSELQQAIDEHIDEIKRETLSEAMTHTAENQQTVKVEGYELTISLEKAER